MRLILNSSITIVAFTLMSLTISNVNPILFDFDSKKTTGDWYIVNDGVMGGKSKSTFETSKDGFATFSGTLSPDNNGGFASIRGAVDQDLEKGLKGVVLRVKGDGLKYNIRFRTSRSFDGYAYQAKIETEKDTWKEFKIPFSEFFPTFRGRTLRNKPVLESQNIEQIGVLIADKQFGDFTMDIDWIKFY